MSAPTREPRSSSAPSSAGSATPEPAWTESVGILPHKVFIEQDPRRGYRLGLRWRVRPEGKPANWKRESLGRTLGQLVEQHRADGLTQRRAIDAAKEWARARARAKLAQLEAGTDGAPTPEAAPARPLTLAETAAVITHRDTGRYPAKTQHRTVVLQSLAFARDVLGEGMPWAALDDSSLVTLWRRRIEASKGQLTRSGEPVDGLRGAEIVIRDVLAIANWLRSEAPKQHRIPLTACVAPMHWRDKLRKDWLLLKEETALPKPRRPRHTNEETQKIRAAARAVDPRLWLLLEVGTNLRAGQVVRCRRSQLSLEGDGQLEVPGSGRKGGAVVLFTQGQRAAVDECLTTGYLRELEEAFQAGEIADYPLFPGGQLAASRTAGDPHAVVERHATAKPITAATLMDRFHDAEDAAGVPPVKGRAFYGGRRSSVDEYKKRKGSREGLEKLGGWSDSTIPDQIYADDEALYAREEARDILARIRGEVPDPAPATQAATSSARPPATPRTTSPEAADDA